MSRIETAIEALRQIILDTRTPTDDIRKVERMIWELKQIK